MAPVATSRDVILKLNATINEIVATPEAKASFAKLGIDPHIGTPESLYFRPRTEFVATFLGMLAFRTLS